jgi:hypothetical protein
MPARKILRQSSPAFAAPVDALRHRSATMLVVSLVLLALMPSFGRTREVAFQED